MSTSEENLQNDLHCGEHGDRYRLMLEAIIETKTLLVLTGAGISAESGLTTLRRRHGWNDMEVRQHSSIEGFRNNPETAWRWWNSRLVEIEQAKPGPGHHALVRIARRHQGFVLATQNVDGLHQRAGSHTVHELHGNLRHARCERCEQRIPLNGPLALNTIEHHCGGLLRPEVILLGEQLPASAFGYALEASLTADVILAVGTSQVVMPAAALLAPRNRNPLVIDINPRPDIANSHALMTLPFPAGVVLGAVADHLEGKKERRGRSIGNPRRFLGLPI